MPYHDLDDLKKDVPEAELIQLTDDAGLGEIDKAVYESCRADADSLVDGYLTGGGYSVPLAVVPTIVKKISKEITIYNLTKRRLRTNTPESMESTYRAQIKTLDGIQKGNVSLGIDKATTSGSTSGAFRTNKTSGSRFFSDSELDKF